MRLLIASHNQGKVKEFQQLFTDFPLEIISLDDAGIEWNVDENGKTFDANARLKAEAYGIAAGLATLADDSGLEVDALGGEPGVLTARFGGPGLTPQDRNELLLEKMKSVPDGRRQARFLCAIALAWPGKAIQSVAGICEGEIAQGPKGEGGFGYDPIFFLPEFGCTMAELPAEIKNRVSHRARAVAAASELIGTMMGIAE
jgi:XTP/dITP diphosphohydrolase